ncbi:MAG TPA: SRPBCC domain-containing protein [Gemmatimonadales bacterium]|nr:SRPBCC domain-containing protein [Gemmatimonadales bacterium]
MPTDKDFKRLVRTRMRKTGEAYTTARAHLLKHRPQPATRSSALRPAPAPSYEQLAGIKDATIKARTGCDWERWVWVLDQTGAQDWSHRAIADHVRRRYKTPMWWTQAVTVGYERIKGLRAVGQRRNGQYEAGKSKTLGAPTGRVYRAFRDARTRRRWLGDVSLTVRTAVPNKTMRITWSDGTSVEWYFVPKGEAKCQVAVQHGKLPDREAADRMKAWWAERLGELDRLLTRPGAR